MKARHKKYYMDIAKLSAQQSYAKRLQVGACAVKGPRIISTSWNGTPSGTDNTCEYIDDNGELKTKDSVLHAEENLILKASADGQATRGAVLFITHAPCIHCARMIYGAQFSEVIYNEEYRSLQGIEFLESVGVKVSKYQEEQDIMLFTKPQTHNITPDEEKIKKKKELFDNMNSIIASVIISPCEESLKPFSSVIEKVVELDIEPLDMDSEITVEQVNKLNEDNN